jgi:hypothetical protein
MDRHARFPNTLTAFGECHKEREDQKIFFGANVLKKMVASQQLDGEMV